MLQWKIAFILCIYINLTALSCISAQKFNDARIQTLLAYVIASKADRLNSTTCGKELQNFRDAVDQRILWSLKVLDSSGGFKTGFIYGNNYWLGSRSQCLDTMNTSPLQISDKKILNNMQYRDTQEEFPPFQINYFVAHFKHNSTLQYHTILSDEDMITLGFCLPASCTKNNLSFILEKILRDRIILIDDLYFADVQLIQVKDLKDDNEWLSNNAFRFICVALAFLLIMTTIGTIYDIFVCQKRLKKNEMNKTSSITTEGLNENYDSDINNMSKEIKTEVNSFSQSERESTIGKVLICFSAYTNTRKIFSMKLDADTIPVIHGLKFLSMCWLILIHIKFFTWDSLDNKIILWRFNENYKYIADIGIMTVDVFFFSSGCLVTYLHLRNKTNESLNKPIDCRENLIKLFIHIIKRFIRYLLVPIHVSNIYGCLITSVTPLVSKQSGLKLTPTYMMVLGISQLSLTRFDKTSQFYMYEKGHEICSKYWWRNLLYINNFFSFRAMCLNWSWYLANDMQFYIIAMMLLILSTIYFYTAVTILSILLIVSVILSGYISYIYEYVPTNARLFRLIDVIYTPPWMRIHPYIIGIIAGYILTKLKNNLVLKRKIIILCWCLANTGNVLCVLFLYYKQYASILATAIYVALYRILWAISITWVVIACSTKHGGIINQLLSFKGWIPLSRLTYCAYLLNPVIIRSITLYSETSMHFEFLPFIIMSVGYITIIYSCSYVLSLMVEIPCISLMQMFILNRDRIYKKVS